MYAAYDEQAIWGVGRTANSALNNAREFRDNKDVSDCKTSVMSEKLAEHVETKGGDIGFSLEDGILYFINDEGDLK